MGTYTTPDGWTIDGSRKMATRGEDARSINPNEQYMADELDEARAHSDAIIAAAQSQLVVPTVSGPTIDALIEHTNKALEIIFTELEKLQNG
jgi:hypothetical protein